MSAKLITTSLIDSVEWLKTAPSVPTRDDPTKTWKEKAYEDMRNTLSRIWTPLGAAQQRGVDFEKKVYATLDSRVDYKSQPFSPDMMSILDKCAGGKTYQKAKIFRQIDGEEYCIYVKYDLIMPDKTIDLKTTTSYKGQSKYLSTMQHKIYCLVRADSSSAYRGMYPFEYLVVEFSEDGGENQKIQHIYEVPYTPPSKEELEAEIMAKITDTIDYLKLYDEPGDLWDLYCNKYCMKW